MSGLWDFRKRTDVPCPNCNCKLTLVTPEIIDNYYICPKCTAVFLPEEIEKKT